LAEKLKAQKKIRKRCSCVFFDVLIRVSVLMQTGRLMDALLGYDKLPYLNGAGSKRTGTGKKIIFPDPLEIVSTRRGKFRAGLLETFVPCQRGFMIMGWKVVKSLFSISVPPCPRLTYFKVRLQNLLS